MPVNPVNPVIAVDRQKVEKAAGDLGRGPESRLPRRGGAASLRRMNRPFAYQFTAVATAAALSVAGCSNMTPGENAAVFGTGAAIAGGAIARAAGLGVGESIAIGAASGAIVAATTYIIAKRKATERQRQIAEARARSYYRSLPPERKTAMKKKNVRYIAVDTAKDERTSPKAEKNVMIWDTESEQVVGNNVYDVERSPAVGSTAKFETYSAEYVGTGS